MKKVAILLVIVFLITCVAGCESDVKGPKAYVESGLKIADTMADMETLLRWTTHVVKGRLVESEVLKGGVNVSEYRFEVKEHYFGQTEEIIRLDAETGLYKKGREYYLFLDKTDSVFWESPLYTVSTDEAVFRAKRTLEFPFTSGTVQYKWKDVEKLIEAAEADGIMGTELIEHGHNYDYITASDTLEEAIKEADLVVKIEILSKQYHTDLYASYYVKTIEFVKGEETDIRDSYSLQYGPERGEEYYLLLKDIGQSPEGRYVVFDKNYIAVEVTPENRRIIEETLE